MKTLSIGRGIFFGVAYTADGKYLLSGHSGQHLRFWSTDTFEEVLRVTLGGYARTDLCSFLLDGQILSTATSAWDLTTALAVLGSPQPGSLLVGSHIALENARTYQVVVATSSRLVGMVHDYGDPQQVRAMVWDRQGKCQKQIDLPTQLRWGRLAVTQGVGILAGAARRTVLLVDLSSGEVLAGLAHTDEPNVLRFSPDGRLLAVAAGRKVWVWDVVTHECRASFPAFQRHAEGLTFNPAGTLLAAGSREGEVRLWDTREFQEVAALQWKIGAVHGLAFSPDGMTIAAAGHKSTIVVWDVE